MVAEIVVLFTGVMARYVFHAPLIWTDELASILFLWLAMLGSVIALQRSEHMRLTAVVGGMSPAGRARTEALASAAVAVFLLMVVPSAWDYASDQWFIETPALGIHDTYRAMAILVGGVLMVITALTRLLRLSWTGCAVWCGRWWPLWRWCCISPAPWLKGFGNWNLVLFFVVLLGAAVLLSVPIGFAFGLATLAYLATLTRTPLTVVVSRMDEGMSSLILLAVPLFVFLGLLIEMTGMARAMVNFLSVAAGACAGRAVVCAAGGDVSGVRHFRVEGGGYGGGGAGAVPGHEAARGKRGGIGVAAGGLGRDERDDSAVAGADHHRVGDGGFDRGAVHRRA